MERMLWGSDRYSSPVQMVLEGWLLSRISLVGLFLCFQDQQLYFTSKRLASFNEHRPLECQMQIEKVFWISIAIFTMLCLCTLMHMRDQNHEDSTSQNFDFLKLDSGAMLILDSSMLLALSLSCGYNFKV